MGKRRAVLVAVVVLATLLLFGRAVRVAGTDDVALDYALAEPGHEDVVVSRVEERLAITRIGAAVTSPARGQLRVVVDRALARAADVYTRWPGSVGIYAIDPENEGKPETATLPSDRTFVIEYPAWQRTPHVVYRSPLVASNDLPIPRAELTDDGRAVVLTFSPGAMEKLQAAWRTSPAARVALVGEGLALGVLPLSYVKEGTVVLHFGDDMRAYARAREARGLFAVGRTPPMTPTGNTPLPVSLPLVVACVLAPVGIALLWLAAVRRVDRARPEPYLALLGTAALGAVLQLAAHLEIMAAGLSPHLDLRFVTGAGELADLPRTFGVTFVVVGLLEEGLKLLPIWFVARRLRAFDEPVDGVVYAAASALGFAAMENLAYFADYRVTGGIVGARGLISAPGHVLLSAMWGYAFGQRLVRRRARVLPWFFCAAAAHALFDSLLLLGLHDAAEVVFAGEALVFLALIRRALRHGVVDPAAPPAGERRFFRVGSRAAFGACAFGMIAVGVALMRVAHQIGPESPRPSALLVVEAVVLLLGFVVAFRAAIATMSLDVALDARGLTYAGALHPWWQIRGAADVRGGLPWRGYVRVETDHGSLVLGPGRRDEMASLAQAIGAARCSRDEPAASSGRKLAAGRSQQTPGASVVA